eukprot:1814880-Rhodomonas_salina.4
MCVARLAVLRERMAPSAVLSQRLALCAVLSQRMCGTKPAYGALASRCSRPGWMLPETGAPCNGWIFSP